jgi:hypothetical protein
MVPWSEQEQIQSVKDVHSVLRGKTLGNFHSGVVGTGGTMRPTSLVRILRALMHPVGEGGSIFDVGCGFGPVILAAMKTGFRSGYGCELPGNIMQRSVFEDARHGLGLDQQTTNGPSDWISSDVLDLNLPLYLRLLITAVFSFWNGLDAAAQLRVLELCRDTFINVRALAVYWTPGWTEIAGIVAAILSNAPKCKLCNSLLIILQTDTKH